MFNNIAGSYDFLNHFLSFGIDRYWRKKVVSFLRSHQPKDILDLACGTGDMGIALVTLHPRSVTGIDISPEMIKLAGKKIKRRGVEHIYFPLQGDAEKMSFNSDHFDAVTIAFGMRNFTNPENSLGEIYRVLKPGGCIAVLEFALPEKFPVRQLYLFYFKTLVPFFGRIISGNRNAYTYLPESVQKFSKGPEFIDMLNNAGFEKAGYQALTFSVCNMYFGYKPG